MMANKFRTIARSEVFEVENPILKIDTVISDVRIYESTDCKTHIEIHADSHGSSESNSAVGNVEIFSEGRNITIKVDRKLHGWKFFGNSQSESLGIVLRVPKTTELDLNTVSADIEIQSPLHSAKLKSVSGDLVLLENPRTTCTAGTVSGSITAHTFTACNYSLKSVSGNVTVHVMPGLDIDVNGKSVSGELASEIALDGLTDSVTSSQSVLITASTVSGDVKIARG